MAKVRNMGTSTMRFNQGVVISGSIDTEYASEPGVALVCTGSLEIASNATNSEVIRIMSDGNQREMVFQNQQGLSMASLNTDGNSDLILSGAGSIALSPGMSEKIILATTASDGSIPTTGNDAFLFVSGTIDSRGTATRGTAVFGGDLVVSGGYNLIVSGTKIDGTQQEITSLSKILLDASTGIYVSGSGRTANIKMGSHFNPIAVSGQTSIAASGESELTVVAGDNMTITTDNSAKSITFNAATGGGWTDDGSIVRLTTSTDSVGIGTASPSTNLHIASTGDAAIFLEADTDNSGETDNAYIKFSQDNTLVAALLGTCGDAGKDPENNAYTDTLVNTTLLGTTTNYPLQFGTNDNVRMTITSDGKIGIGAGSNGTNPLYGKLQLVQDTDNDEGGITIINSAGSRAYRLWADASNVSRIDSGNDGGGEISINGVGGGNVGIGIENPTVNLDVAGTGKFSTAIQTPLLEYTDGTDALKVLAGGYMAIEKGVSYSRGVRVSNGVSDPNNDGTNLWIKIASVTDVYRNKTSAATFLVTMTGFETSDNRTISGPMLLHVRFTPLNYGPYYDADGTWAAVQALHSDDLEGFDPATDIFLTSTADASDYQDADIWINAKVKDKHIFVTHLGGSGHSLAGNSAQSLWILNDQTWSDSTTSLGNDTGGIWASIKTSTVTTAGNVTVGGNLTVDTSTLFVDSSSNEVGIGTTSPDSVLHVTAATPKVRIESQAGNETGLDLYENGDPKWQIYNDPNVSDVLRFRAGAGGSVDTNDTFTYERVADGEGKLWLTSIGYSDGDTAITIEDGGYLQLNAGVKHSPGVKVNADVTASDNQWIKIATTPYAGDDYDISASTFLVTVVGVNFADSSPGRQSYIVSARVFADDESPYYRDRATDILVQPLDSEYLDGFDPTTDIALAIEKDSTPLTDIWIKITQKSCDVYVTHMNGSTVDTPSTDIGWTINSGQAWSASLPSVVTYSLIYGDWTSQKMKTFETTGAEFRGYTTIPFDTSGTMTRTGEYDIPGIPGVSETPDSTPDLILLCNDGGTANGLGNRVVRFPPVAESDRRVITIKDSDGSADSSGSSTSPIRVTGFSSETIDGSVDYNLTTAYGALTVICNGTEWKILSKIDT